MIHHDHVQGSPEWLQARLGCVTASNMHRVVTEAGKLRTARTGNGLAQTAQTYLNELLAEWIIGQPVNAEVNQYMQRGTDMEAEAAAWYAWEKECTPETTGFITTDCGRVGASPDRLIGSDGILEIKVPGIVQHVSNLLEMTTDYTAQVQTQLWVTERDWADLLSYNPAIPSVVKRIERDCDFISNMEEALFGDSGFLQYLDIAKGIIGKLDGIDMAGSLCHGLGGNVCDSRDGLEVVENVGPLCRKCRTIYATNMEEIFK